MLSAFPDVATLSTVSCQHRSRFSFSTNRRPVIVEKPVPDHHPVYSVLSELFTRSMTRHREGIGSTVWCEPPQVEISSIWETINPSLLDKYQQARKDIAARRPNGCSPLHGVSATKCVVEEGHVNLNEYILFHGCPSKVVEQIQDTGLDPQRGGEHGKMFGIGAYFAENASKSDYYTTCEDCSTSGSCKHPGKERCILVARVLLGETKLTKSPCKKSTRAPDGHDSIMAVKREHGGAVDHMEFVTYKEQNALVRYLIYYRHKSDCPCHNCIYRRRP